MITPKDEIFNKEMWENLNTPYITQQLEEMYGKLPESTEEDKELKTEVIGTMASIDK